MAKGLTRNRARRKYDAGLPPVVVEQVVADMAGLQAAATQERIDWGSKLHDLPAAWRRTRGSGIRVAVLDTGVDADHPDLVNAIEATQDFTGDGVEDVHGHGTHCAGIIAARRNNVGFVGVAPECQLLIAKVLGNNGSGSNSDIASGVNWAVDSGADIISMSLGGPNSDGSLFRAIHRALMENKIVVCAAGNEGSMFQNSIGYPGRYGSVISVGAHDQNGNPAGFSSREGKLT